MSKRTNQLSADFRVTKHELVILANALNETLEAIEPWEFSTRVGADSTEVEALRKRLLGVLDSLGDDP